MEIPSLPNQDSANSRENVFSSWSISILLHAILLLVLTFTITNAVPVQKGISQEETAEVGIAFRTQTEEKTLYESAAEAMSEDSSSGEDSASQDSTSKKTEAEVISALSSEIAANDMPAVPDVAALAPGMAPSEGSGSTGLQRVTDGLGDVTGVGRGSFEGFGKGTVSCFGTSGKGSRFIFVFDRSASMSFRSTGTAVTPMAAAKLELRNSLRMLKSNQQFQIIFYNGLEEDILQYETNKMVFATKENLVGAERFLSSITAMGGTDHRTALALALSRHPDVIFFLTDADENETTINAADLERIRRSSGRTQINGIQFGNGPQPKESNWLKRLAEQSGGQFVYLDVNRL